MNQIKIITIEGWECPQCNRLYPTEGEVDKCCPRTVYEKRYMCNYCNSEYPDKQDAQDCVDIHNLELEVIRAQRDNQNENN